MITTLLKVGIPIDCCPIWTYLIQVFENESDTTDRQYYEARLGLTQGGIAIILISTSDVQVKEKQDRIIDSLNSVCGPIKNGIIAGGISLLYSSLLLDDPSLRQNVINKHFINIDGCDVITVQQRKSINRDQLVGYDILNKCLHIPARAMLTNLGEIASVIVANVLENAIEKLHQLKKQNIHGANTTQMITIKPKQQCPFTLQIYIIKACETNINNSSYCLTVNIIEDQIKHTTPKNESGIANTFICLCIFNNRCI